MLIGIVGKPSAGKSTFFKAATLAEAEIANYPFTTIKPNHATAFCKTECADKFFNVQCNPRTGFCLNHNRFIPVEILDVAGLVPGAHKGLGMGSQFLNDLNQADALIHVIDVSGSINEKGEPVPPLSYEPEKDIAFLEKELDYWYLEILKKGWERFARTVMQEKKDIVKAIAKQLSGLHVTEEHVKDSIKKLSLDADPTKWSEENLLMLASELRKLSKPMVIAANKIDVPGAEKNFLKLQQKFPEYKIIPCSAESELALKEAAKSEIISYVPGENSFKILKEDSLNEKQKKALEFIARILKKFGSTGIQETIDYSIFKLLKYKAIFPGGVNKLSDSDGNVLPDCFLLEEKATALDFAFRLHTDFGKNFIKAIDVKTKLPVGKDHILKNGDVIEIMSKK